MYQWNWTVILSSDHPRRRLVARLSILLQWSLSVFIVTVAGPAAHAEQSMDNEAIQEVFDYILESRGYPSDRKMAQVQEALDVLGEQQNPDSYLLARGCLAVGRAHYLHGDQETALTSLDRCLTDETRVRHPTLYLTTRSLRAGLLLVSGRAEDSLAEFEQLLSEDHSSADPAAMLKVRTNYASTLSSNGQILASIEEFQTVLQQAMEAGQDSLVLDVGNNFIVLLIEQRMYSSAEVWLDRLSATVERAPDGVSKQSLELHALQLQYLMGDAEGAVLALREFVAQRPVAPPVHIGNAYEFMSVALRDLGEYDASLAMADRAIALLDDKPLEVINARLSKVRALLGMNRYADAAEALEAARSESLQTPIVQKQLFALELQIRLGITGSTDLISAFEQFVKASEIQFDDLIDQNTRYYDAKLTTERQRSDIQRIEASRARLAAEARANAVRANALSARVKASRQMRNLTIALVVLFMTGLVLYLHSRTQRRFERQLRQQEQALNEQLTVQIEEKSKALILQIEEQATLERALAKKAQTEAIGELTGNVAHDFNNLMQVVSIANEELANVTSTPLQRSLLEGSNSALGHAKSMIRQLLAYARRQRLETVSISFPVFFDDTRALFDAAVGQSIQLRIDDQSGGDAAAVDKSQLTTMILNLLTNARDAMPRGGEVVIAVHKQEVHDDNDCEWTDLASGKYIAITVSDQGVGMTGEQVERAFEPFFTTKDEPSGTGLGLSSVYGFVKQSKGDMRITQTSSSGTSVQLMLPSAPGETADDKPIAARLVDLNGLSLLLVEDNAVLATTLLAMIAHLGIDACHVTSVDAALARLKTSTFDVVLSDVRLPGAQDGRDLQQWALAHRADMPVLLMTGYSDGNLDGPGAMVINKPFTQRELTERLQQVITTMKGAVESVPV